MSTRKHGNTDHPLDDAEKVYELARRRVRILLAERNLDVATMADDTGMTKAQLYDRIRRDWHSARGLPQPRFNLAEIKAISARYNVNESEFFNEIGVRIIRDDDGPQPRSGRNSIRYSGETVLVSGEPHNRRALA